VATIRTDDIPVTLTTELPKQCHGAESRSSLSVSHEIPRRLWNPQGHWSLPWARRIQSTPSHPVHFQTHANFILLSTGKLSFRFCYQNFISIFHIPLCVVCTPNPLIIDLTTVMIFGEYYKLSSVSLCKFLHPSAMSSFLGPNIFLGTLLSASHLLGSSLRMIRTILNFSYISSYVIKRKAKFYSSTLVLVFSNTTRNLEVIYSRKRLCAVKWKLMETKGLGPISRNQKDKPSLDSHFGGWNSEWLPNTSKNVGL
jgi:hypothetical protein